MDWHRAAEVWPHAAHSRFVDCRPHRWHVQEMGAGPVVLLLHGVGGATHSWRDLAPRLARTHRTVAVDLPGQGFSRMGTRTRLAPGPMADDLARLCAQEGWQPQVIVGHSAGAALAARLAPLLRPRPTAVIGLNAALEPFDGAARWLFPMMARALSLNPMTAPMVAATMTPQTVDSLLRGTGSTLNPVGRALYRMVLSDASHLDGALSMMAQWNLEAMPDHLRRLDLPVLLLAGARDTAVPPASADRAARLLLQAEVRHLEALGHLAHEEDPDTVFAAVRAFLDTLDQPIAAPAAP